MAESDQATRLAGLARVWGQVKYVHPAMAPSHIDWDAALVRAIPVVEHARSDQQYREAIQGLLDELHDPFTRVIEKEALAPAASLAGAPPELRLERIDAKTASLTILNEPALESDPILRARFCARLPHPRVGRSSSRSPDLGEFAAGC
jgi:hypothetical protein